MPVSNRIGQFIRICRNSNEVPDTARSLYLSKTHSRAELRLRRSFGVKYSRDDEHVSWGRYPAGFLESVRPRGYENGIDVAQRNNAGFIGHHDQIRAAYANVDNIANSLAGIPAPLPGPQRISEVAHPVQNRLYFRYNVNAIDKDLFALRGAQGDM